MSSDVQKRLETLEKKVAAIKDNRDWKKEYKTAEVRWGKEREELIKGRDDSAGQLREILLRFLGLDKDALLVQTRMDEVDLNLEHNELTIAISQGDRKEVSMTTKTVAGKILYCALEELSQEGFSEVEASDAMLELGWNVGHNTLAPGLGGLVRQGYLIKIAGAKPTKYRLPLKVKMNVKKESEE